MIINLGDSFNNRQYCTKTDVIYSGFNNEKKIKRNAQGVFKIKVKGEVKEVPEFKILSAIEQAKQIISFDRPTGQKRLDQNRPKIEKFLKEGMKVNDIVRKTGVKKLYVLQVQEEMCAE